ncbi:hypothetical protein AXFE_11770 [Acidithrix ferrooxidans]|uniref:Uncharacterized protein n=1 Tax=Acidithrix ferrooxidans TaxID=1280514 RepID=A0A0D8HIX6_9ACTN|nr:hypothetical protein AXFE_11770 [Acidithrix ferrooxidans]
MVDRDLLAKDFFLHLIVYASLLIPRFAFSAIGIVGE